MFKIFFSFAILHMILLGAPLFSWWETGHMVVAEIAQRELSPKAKMEVEKLIKLFEDYFPKSSDFLTASVWADDVAAQGFTGRAWHGTAIAYDPEHILSDEAKKLISASNNKNDILFGIQQSINTLKNKRASRWTKAVMIRFLIHLVGDSHMPLHSATLYNKTFPKGDLHGCRFKLVGVQPDIKHLHALWDSMFVLDSKKLSRPLSDLGIKKITQMADELLKKYPKEGFAPSLEKDPKEWIQESYQIAIDTAYTGITPLTKPSPIYVEKGKTAAEKRIVLAGLRLGHILQELFPE